MSFAAHYPSTNSSKFYPLSRNDHRLQGHFHVGSAELQDLKDLANILICSHVIHTARRINGHKSASFTGLTARRRRPVILADGTYATQSAALETVISDPSVQRSSSSQESKFPPVLWQLLPWCCCCLQCAKLVLRLEEVQSSKVEVNKANTQALLYMEHGLRDIAGSLLYIYTPLLFSAGYTAKLISCPQKFLSIRPRKLREAFNCDEPNRIKSTSIHNIWSFLSTF